jgi:hypothetical protein
MKQSYDVDDCLLGCFSLMIEAVSTSETPVNFCHTTRRNIPEDSHLHTRRRKNLKSRRVEMDHPVQVVGKCRREFGIILMIMRADRCHHHAIILQHCFNTCIPQCKHPVCIDFSQVVAPSTKSDPQRVVSLLTDTFSINHYNL